MMTMIITFPCLLRLIFRGPEIIDTPSGKVEIRFSWRGLKVSGPGSYAGRGCYMKLDK